MEAIISLLRKVKKNSQNIFELNCKFELKVVETMFKCLCEY